MWAFRANGHFVLSCAPVLLERKFGINRHFVGICAPCSSKGEKSYELFFALY